MISESKRLLNFIEYRFVVILLTLCLLLYERTDPFFYSLWGASLIVLFFSAAFLIIRVRIERVTILTFFAMAAWLGYAIFVTPFVRNIGVHLKVIFVTFLYTAAVVGFISYLGKDVLRFFRVMVYFTQLWILIGFLYFFLYFTGIVRYGGAFSGIYHNRNSLAIMGNFLLCFSLFSPMETVRNFSRYTTWIISALLAVLVLFTASSKGLIGLLLVVVLYITLLFRGAKRLWMIIILSLFLILGFVTFGRQAIERFQSKLVEISPQTGETISGSGAERLWLILESFRIIKKHPVTGIGVHNSSFYLVPPRILALLKQGAREKFKTGVYSHNNYTEMLLNGGIPAFLLYYLPLFFLFMNIIKKRQLDPLGTRIRHLLISLITLKLAFDVAMVSYLEFSHIFVVAICYMMYGFVLQRPQSIKQND